MVPPASPVWSIGPGAAPSQPQLTMGGWTTGSSAWANVRDGDPEAENRTPGDEQESIEMWEEPCMELEEGGHLGAVVRMPSTRPLVVQHLVLHMLVDISPSPTAQVGPEPVVVKNENTRC